MSQENDDSRSSTEYKRKHRSDEDDDNSLDALADEPESKYVPLRERKKKIVRTQFFKIGF